MISGRFDELGYPIVECRIVIQRFRINSPVSFLLDTGAVRTCLHSGDATAIGIPYSRLGNSVSYRGIGGRAAYFREQAFLCFADQRIGRYHVYEILLHIAERHPNVDDLPSLLGRDVTNRWHMQYDPANARLQFVVRQADYTIDAAQTSLPNLLP